MIALGLKFIDYGLNCGHSFKCMPLTCADTGLDVKTPEEKSRGISHSRQSNYRYHFACVLKNEHISSFILGWIPQIPCLKSY